MAASTSTISSINFLPEYLRTDKNSKFLSATLDQWIQPAQLERISGYIGSKNTPNYVSTSDVYIPESLALRRDYQLTPALVVNDALYNIQDVIALDDLIDEIAVKGGKIGNLDRLLRGDFYSYNPWIDWDKLVNYQEYYWLVEGPTTIPVFEDIITIDQNILGRSTYTNTSTGLTLTNGLKLRFTNPQAGLYYDRDYFVEGVGTDQGIRLVDFQTLITPEPIASLYKDQFDSKKFDYYKFDDQETLPLIPEYVTINRASQDINSWSRYNRWVHSEVIRTTAEFLGQIPDYPVSARAQRPIIEFAADLKLYNHGTLGIPNVDFIDNVTVDPTVINGTDGYYIDQVLLQKGNRIIFNASSNPNIIYQVDLKTKKYQLELVESMVVTVGSQVTIDLGVENHGTDWWFNGTNWQLSQQHTTINQAPLFDLYNSNKVSYSDLPSNFRGNKIFGYTLGTGVSDRYLGFPLKYRNAVEQGDYLFSNYFMTDTIAEVASSQHVTVVPTSQSYLKFSHTGVDDRYVNVWISAVNYSLPVLQFQTIGTATNSIAVSAINTPAEFNYEVYLNTSILSNAATSVSVNSGTYLINFNNTLPSGTNVLLKFYTTATATSSGYYEPPLSQTNNPLNGPISQFTLSELSDHLKTMTERNTNFVGIFPGASNLRDLSNIGQYGTRLISSADPIAFADMFIGKKEHSVVDAITKVSDHYNQFKAQVMAQMNRMVDQQDPVRLLDEILSVINQDKTPQSLYYLSDMIGYGTNKNTTSTVVTVAHYIGEEPAEYPIADVFSITELSLRSVLVYLNGTQLILGSDYNFVLGDAYISFDKIQLNIGDVITVVNYPDTSGCYIPPTPTKLGLYPSFEPKKYIDNTYIIPRMVIQGHDGSITIAYDDFRDDVLLEFEKRVYNNIKTQYRPELFDINSVLPGAFRSNQYSLSEVNDILESGFIKWSGLNGVDYTNNNIFDETDPFTWNYLGGYISSLGISVGGYWRGIYKYLYDTDRPHTHPWEMFGFNKKPDWWDEQYGEEYENFWLDVEAGIIRNGDRAGTYSVYARPGIVNLGLIPVDPQGNLIDPSTIISNITIYNRRQGWQFGDQAPVETAWRRSSYYPFAVQRLLALTKPASYASLMYDLSRVTKNIAGQWTYGANNAFFNFTDLVIHSENSSLTSGYSQMISEIGKQRTQNYISELRNDLSYANFNLFYKVGGFVSKDKLQITIDAYEPNSNSPGAILPVENYTLRLNVSNPIISASMSGMIVQKSTDGNFLIKGYDTQTPYFNVYTPVRTSNTPTVTVGGVSEPYVTWTNGTAAGGALLSSVDTTSAVGAGGVFYQAGQIVSYGSSYYRVKISHQAENSFNQDYYQLLSGLPTTGGASAQIADRFDKVVKEIPYGTEFSNIQSLYDVIVGYGAWLKDQGFVFDEYNNQINDVINWEFSAKEFLYWTTQNWATNNVITLSPFSDQIKYAYNQSVVDNLFDTFYEYSLLLANGTPFPKNNLFVNREAGVCTISSKSTTDGIYFVRLNSVQKEHSLVFNNSTIFNDVIYDIETGYQQQRMKLSGFRTKNWTGDLFSPGFVYDNVQINNWQINTPYQTAAVVLYNGTYYSAKTNLEPSLTFDVTQWSALDSKPTGGLLPNFDYKINQFQDFYSLDIDNFDASQEKMAQHLTGYTPRVYLNNIFTDPIAQYKFYQGFIREKGTRNAVQKLSKATIQNLQGTIDFNEEWAFRIGEYGSFSTYKELESTLVEGTFFENPQIINFVNKKPDVNNLIYYSTASNRTIIPDNYDPTQTFYTTSGTYLNNAYILPTAGYVRVDDVTYTAYNENSLLSITNNNEILTGDTAWLGFKKTGDWDVLRYTVSPVRVVNVEIGIYGQELILTTNQSHRLSKGDIVSLLNYTSQIDGIYIIQSIVSSNQFSIASTIQTIDPTLVPGTGQLFTFSTARSNTFDTLPTDRELLSLPEGSLFWVNSDREDGTGSWTVYNKIQNYYPIVIASGIKNQNEQLGYSISRVGSDNLFIVGSPTCPDPVKNDPGYGKVTAYVKVNGSPVPRFRYFINPDEYKPYYNSSLSTSTGFGSAVAYDDYIFPGTQNGLIFAGAPKVSRVRTVYGTNLLNTATISTLTDYSTFIEQGLVTISSVDPVSNEETRQLTLVSPYPQSYERFGSELYVQLNTGSKLLLVGAPGKITGVGSVYAYRVGYYTTSTDRSIQEYKQGYRTTSTVTYASVRYINTLTPTTSTAGMLWGHSISGSDDGSVIAVGAPGYKDRTGLVTIFNGTNTTQVIQSPFSSGGGFGSHVEVSADGSYLIVSAPDVYGFADNNDSYGKVAIYKKEGGLFNTDSTVQILHNPLYDSKMRFGYNIVINTATDILVISALGTDYIDTTFDENQTRNIGGKKFVSSISTIDDSGTTEFFTEVERTGTVYVYNRLHNRFVLSEELRPQTVYEGADHGHGLQIAADNTILVSAPAVDNALTGSYFYQYASTSTDSFSWKAHRVQENLVDISTIQRLVLIDSYNEAVVDYLETIDPAKGYISGLADQEIKYKSLFDPAVYAIGSTGTVVNPSVNWTDDHVGELWWDLSTVKYQWYEQGDLEYRKNNWGSTFPGSSIDVYEWIGSTLLPSQWSRQADTVVGLTQGISGQPKYPDDSSVAVKQTYDPITDSLSNYYYYWIKNTVIVPAVRGRKISAYQVASIIADPVAYGLQYATPISADAIAVANIGAMPVGERINLNIAMDLNPDNVPKHTEWLLLQENSQTSLPNSLLEKKLLDSLIGHDKLGNLVPDPALNPRQAYGVSIRPRQSLFKNRFQALRNLLDFSNNVLINIPITGNYSFTNLNRYEPIPDRYSHQWDQIVEALEERDAIDVRSFTAATAAQLTATIYDGKLINVTIVNPGIGYLISPTVTVVGNSTTPAVITTEIDNFGQIVSVTLVDGGSGYYATPELSVRGYTVIVRSDSETNGLWAKHTWDAYNNRWARVHTQSYDTRLYWNTVDYASADFNQYKIIDYTIASTYELTTLVEATPGQYIKINNIGDNRSAIVTPTTAAYGSFSDGYDLLWSQNGTIQLSNNLWDVPDSQLGFDEYNNFDTTLYNQAPDIELEYILTALKDDIFINELKVNWNLFFFTAVKYALYEQKLLDWAFKTTFINVNNYAGALDQRPVYKITDSTYFEDYINEVKPYHTKIRQFITNQTVLDLSSSYNTDFDLPSYYNSLDNQFETVSVGNALTNVYPWKSWSDNYSYGVNTVEIIDPGTQYTSVPIVEISCPDLSNGTTATAQAYIGGGKIYLVEILDAGSGYTKTPTAEIVGGTTGTTATVSLTLLNEKVRRNTVGIKFDRISIADQMGNIDVVDEFYCDGSKSEFILSWLAQADKQTIDITLDNDLVLISDYTIKYYTGNYNGYNKKYSKLVFLNYIPKLDQIVQIKYKKNVELMSAFERSKYFTSILDLTTATSVASTGKNLQGVMFDHTSAWTEPYPAYDDFAWADAVDNYTVATSTATSVTVAYPDTKWPVRTIIQLDSVVSIKQYQYANVIGVATTPFDTSTVVVVIAVDTSTNSVTLNSGVKQRRDIPAGSSIEFWNNDTNFSILDVATSATSWSTVTSNALSQYMGIDPDDFALNTSTGLYLLGGNVNSNTLFVDGDGYYTERTSFTPEELVAGQSSDSLGVNVYTKDRSGAPTVVVSYFDILANSTSTVKLDVLPPNVDSITVILNPMGTFENTVLEYSTSTEWTAVNQFSIDWVNPTLIIAPQPQSGTVGYTMLLINGTEFVDYSHQATASGIDSVQLRSLGAYDSLLRSAYVTLDGVAVSATTSTSTIYYTMNYVDPDGSQTNRRAAVDIYNISTSTAHLAQAWFFDSEYTGFNTIQSQSFVYDGSTSSFLMSYPPGNSGPAEGNMIVEVITPQYTKRLMPPDIAYYQYVTGGSDTFNIPTTFGQHRAPFTAYNIRVYLNGNLLAFGYDYNLAYGSQIVMVPNVLADGDTVAIISYALNDTLNYDFRVYGNMLMLTTNVGQNSPTTLDPGDVVKVITFNNQDNLLMETQIFPANLSGTYQISRPILDSNYVWVSVDNQFLISRIDFTVLDDQRTIQIADQFTGNQVREVIVTSITTNDDPVLGYRIFTDMFNRTQFKRLSKANTTYLTQPLYVYDTEIHVRDSSVLSKPLVSKRIPGVVIIDGERIEYYRVSNNVLSQLRRGTLGTAPKNHSQIYTKVIDQGVGQTVPYAESIRRQTYINIGTTNTYVITTTNTTTYYDTQIVVLSSGTGAVIKSDTPYDNLIEVYTQVNYGTVTISTATGDFNPLDLTPYATGSGTIEIDIPPQPNDAGYVVQTWFIGQGDPGASVPYVFRNDGMTIQTDPVDTGIPLRAEDQIAVYYGGRVLNKNGTFQQDLDRAYDSSPVPSTTATVATLIDLPPTKVVGTAYITTDTNQVWVYTRSNRYDSYLGYEYQGLNYVPPEFTLDPVTQQLTLNIPEALESHLPVRVDIVKRDYVALTEWNDPDPMNLGNTLSLMQSTSTQAKFLRNQPAELPDAYYYGGDPDLTDTSGFALTLPDGNPLEDN